MEIRYYEPKDETGWLRCRVLSFLDTAYFDNVVREKERYHHPSLELVAEKNNQIVGLIDIEYEKEPGFICSNDKLVSGMIWHLAVHPDYQRNGIARRLLNEAIQILAHKNVNRLEAWTRDDFWVNKWYESNGFMKKDTYYHVYLEGKEELNDVLELKMSNLHPVQAFAHYVGDKHAEMKQRFKRVHECNMYERIFNN